METVIRVAIVYFFVMIFFRIMGKREVGQLSPFDLVLLMLIPDISSMGMMREDYSITNTLIGLSTILSLVFLNSVLTYKSKKAEDIIQGVPSVLFHDGKFLEKEMQLERISPDEVIEALHKAGFEHLKQVKWVILEPDGKISCIPYPPGGYASKKEDEHIGAA